MIPVYPKGTILLFETGEISDFGYCGHAVTLQDLDLGQETRETRERLGKDADGNWVIDDWEHGPEWFVADLVARRLIAPIECKTVHIGSHGQVRLRP